MRRSLPATAVRTVRRAVTWRPKAQGTDSIKIAWLISPFRYDVVVRSAFFDAIAQRSPEQSTADFVAAAEHQDYFVWFREIEARRFRPWLLGDAAALRSDYRERVAQAIRTFESFSVHGYQARYPVTLRSVGAPSPSDSGVTLARTLHVGDGGHRLALLLRSDQELEPHMYRVDPRPRPILDNTAVLLRHLPIDDTAYLRFISPGYVADAVTDLDELERAVRTQCPARLEELRRVVELHGKARAVCS